MWRAPNITSLSAAACTLTSQTVNGIRKQDKKATGLLIIFTTHIASAQLARIAISRIVVGPKNS